MSLPDNQVLAAIDIGSNSFHLIVSRVVQGALQTVASHRDRVQLALGMTSDYALDPSAMQRGYDCLQLMGKILQDARPDQVRVVATYALRAAANRNTFLQQAETLLGYPIEVISGREEARLIFQAIAHTETIERETLVIDVGGGSTELASGTGFDPHFRASCRMGCVSFSEAFFSGAIDQASFRRAQVAAFSSLENYLSQLTMLSWENIYATSGSAKALAQAATYLGASPGSIGLAQLLQLRDEIVARGSLEWLGEIGISESRIQLVPGGLAILVACMQCLKIDRLDYRDVALREGVLYELLEQMRHPDIRQRSRLSMQLLYSADTSHAERVASCAAVILQTLPADWFGDNNTARDILMEAAHLHEVGLQISANGVQKHSAYILANSDLPGYNEEQQALLASLVRLYRRKIRPDDLPELRMLERDYFIRLLVVLRLAVIVNITRGPFAEREFAQQFRLAVWPKGLQLQIAPELLQSQVLLASDLEREQEQLAEAGFELTIKTQVID